MPFKAHTHDQKGVTQIILSTRTIAFNKDGSFVQLTLQQFNQCSQSRNFLLCPNYVPIFKPQVQTCETFSSKTRPKFT